MTSISGRGIQFQHLNTEQSTQRTERGENTTENRVLDANNAEDLNAENLEAVDTIQFRAGEGEDIVLLDLSQIPAESRTQFLNELKGRLLAGQADGLNAEEFYDAIGESLDAAEIEPSQDRTSSSRLFVPPVGSSTSHVTLSRSSTGPAIDIPISDNPNDVPRAEIDRENKRVLIVTEERSEFFDIPDVAPSTPDSQQTGRAGEDTLPDTPSEVVARAQIVKNQAGEPVEAWVNRPGEGDEPTLIEKIQITNDESTVPRGRIDGSHLIITNAEGEEERVAINENDGTNVNDAESPSEAQTPMAQALQSVGEIVNVSGLTLEAFQDMNPQEHLNILLKIDETHWRTLLTELTVKQRDDIQDAAQALVRQFNREIATNPPPPPPRSGASSGGVSSGGVSSGGVAPAQPTRRHLSPEEIAAKEAIRDKAQRLIQLIEDMRPAPEIPEEASEASEPVEPVEPESEATQVETPSSSLSDYDSQKSQLLEGLSSLETNLTMANENLEEAQRQLREAERHQQMMASLSQTPSGELTRAKQSYTQGNNALQQARDAVAAAIAQKQNAESARDAARLAVEAVQQHQDLETIQAAIADAEGKLELAEEAISDFNEVDLSGVESTLNSFEAAETAILNDEYASGQPNGGWLGMDENSMVVRMMVYGENDRHNAMQQAYNTLWDSGGQGKAKAIRVGRDFVRQNVALREGSPETYTTEQNLGKAAQHVPDGSAPPTEPTESVPDTFNVGGFEFVGGTPAERSFVRSLLQLSPVALARRVNTDVDIFGREAGSLRDQFIVAAHQHLESQEGRVMTVDQAKRFLPAQFPSAFR